MNPAPETCASSYSSSGAALIDVSSSSAIMAVSVLMPSTNFVGSRYVGFFVGLSGGAVRQNPNKFVFSPPWGRELDGASVREDGARWVLLPPEVSVLERS